MLSENVIVRCVVVKCSDRNDLMLYVLIVISVICNVVVKVMSCVIWVLIGLICMLI